MGTFPSEIESKTAPTTRTNEAMDVIIPLVSPRDFSMPLARFLHS